MDKMNINIKQEPKLEDEGDFTIPYSTIIIKTEDSNVTSQNWTPDPKTLGLVKREGSPTTHELDEAVHEEDGPEESLSDEGIGGSPVTSEEEAGPYSVAVRIPSEGLKLLEELGTIHSHPHEERQSSGSSQFPRQGEELLTELQREIFHCEKCTMAFTEETKLLRHMKMVHTFVCQHCGMQFASDTDCLKHEDVHNKDTEYSCNECNLIFENNTLLQEHYGKHVFACSHCDKTYTNNIALLKHEQAHQDKDLNCMHCGKKFKNSGNLQIHKRSCVGSRLTSDKNTGHPSEMMGEGSANDMKQDDFNSPIEDVIKPRRGSDEYFHCPECPMAFSSSQDFAIHIERGHSTPARVMTGKSLMETPVSHTKEAKFPELSNPNEEVLENRKDSVPIANGATENRPVFKCTICEKSYARKCDLTMHMKRGKHSSKVSSQVSIQQLSGGGACKKSPSTNTDFECSLCSKTFANKHNLKRHMKLGRHENKKLVKSHGSDSAAQCKICSKVFKKRRYLTAHINCKHPELKSRLETKVNGQKESTFPESKCDITASKMEGLPKTFKCEECPKAYGRKGYLAEHMRRKHPQKMSNVKQKLEVESSRGYSCEICSKVCKKRRYLTAHINLKHPELKNRLERKGKGQKESGSNLKEVQLPATFTESKCGITASKMEGLAKTFKCHECPKAYGRKGHLAEHMRHKHPQKMSIVKQKLEVESPRGLYKCKICSKTFTKQYSLNVHMKLGKHVIQCNICLVVFKQKRYLLAHLKRKHPRIKCPLCPKDYGKKWHMKEHMKLKHPESLQQKHTKVQHKEVVPNEVLSCSECQKEFPRRCDLNKHLKLCKHIYKKNDESMVAKTQLDAGSKVSQPLGHICPLCSKSYSCSSALGRHIRDKHPEHQCKKCLKSFGSRPHLTAHMKRKHPGSLNRYPASSPQCSQCKKTFPNKLSLTTHIKLKHKSTQNRHRIISQTNQIKESKNAVYRCGKCSRVFTRKSALTHHMRRGLHHSGSSLFQCPKCPHNFKLKHSFLRHMKRGMHVADEVHEDIQNKEVSSYLCPVCSKSFPNEGALMKHSDHCKQQDHPNQSKAVDQRSSFQCLGCSRTFASQVSLKKHRHYCKHQGHTNQSIAVNQGSSLKCSGCSRSFVRPVDLKNHGRYCKQQGHANQSQPVEHRSSFQCSGCLRSFASQGALNKHSHYCKPHGQPNKSKVVAQKSFRCSACSISYGSQGDLKKHSRYCKQQGPLKQSQGSSFQCSTCSKSFASQNDLKDHTNSQCNGHVNVDQSDHVEQKEASGSEYLKCPKCPKYYKRGPYLQTHMESAHPQYEGNTEEEGNVAKTSKELLPDSKGPGKASTSSAKETTWKCSECGKQFSSRADLKRHQDTHVFMCNYCNRFFTTQISLEEHACTQRKDALNCKQCHKNFVNAKQLRNHKCSDDAVASPSHSVYSNTSKVTHKRKHESVASPPNSVASNSSKSPKKSKVSHKCGLCQKIFRSSRDLEVHEEQHTLTEFEDEPSGTSSETNKKPALSTIPKRLLRCRFCEKEFPSLELVHNHERSHVL